MLSLEYPPDIVGGLGTHVFELITGLAQTDSVVDLLAFSPRNSKVVETPETRVHFIAPSAATRHFIQQTTMVHRAVTEALCFNHELTAYGQKLIEKQRPGPDLIHCHDWFTFPAAIELKRRFGIPVVGTIHILNHPIVRRWGMLPDQEVEQQERNNYCQADTLITVSESMREIIRSTYELPADRIHVVHNGLDVQPFMKTALSPAGLGRLRQSIAALDEKIVIFAGRLTPQKGIAPLFAAAAQVLEQYPKVRYLIIGEPDAPDSEQMVQQLLDQYPSLKEKIKLLGKVSRKQLAILYQIADIALVPSVYEPFGYAAVEAMGAAVPVVATRVGGLAEIIEDGKTGLLVPVQAVEGDLHQVDEKALVAAQLALLRDGLLAKQIGAAGQRHVADKFNLQAMARSTMRVYRHAISDFRARNGGAVRAFWN
jgi:glycosyltransferase involved in cell wall biosynthesis